MNAIDIVTVITVIGILSFIIIINTYASFKHTDGIYQNKTEHLTSIKNNNKKQKSASTNIKSAYTNFMPNTSKNVKFPDSDDVVSYGGYYCFKRTHICNLTVLHYI